MIFIVRGLVGETPPGVRVVLTRYTPPLVAGADGQQDRFCVTDDDNVPQGLRNDGYAIVAIHDGWYADDASGGVAVWGSGRYWEVRDTPFTIRQRDTDF